MRNAFRLLPMTLSGILGFLTTVSCSNETTSGTADKPVTPPPAFEPTKAKAEQGNSEAQNALGDLYANGQGVTADFKEAANWYRKASDQGYARAQFNLATLYAAGMGVTREPAEAAKWYRKAAEQGNVEAQYTLAQVYASGTGVKVDSVEAVKWYRAAADQGDSLSQYNLGRRYKEGNGVQPDPVQAYAWLSIAEANGVPDAGPYRKEVKAELSTEQLAKAEAQVKAFKPQKAASNVPK